MHASSLIRRAGESRSPTPVASSSTNSESRKSSEDGGKLFDEAFASADTVQSNTIHSNRILSWLNASAGTGITLEKGRYREYVERTRAPFDDQIERDVSRTFPAEPLFRNGNGQERLRHVLRAWAFHAPEKGYVQGMNFIAGYLILHTESDELAFLLLVRLLQGNKYGLVGLYEEGLPRIFVTTFQVERLMQHFTPKLLNRFNDLHVGLMTYLPQWLLTLFTGPMPSPAKDHVVDFLFERGFAALIAVSISLLRSAESKLLEKINSGNPQVDFDTCMLFLKADIWKLDCIAIVEEAKELASSKGPISDEFLLKLEEEHREFARKEAERLEEEERQFGRNNEEKEELLQRRKFKLKPKVEMFLHEIMDDVDETVTDIKSTFSNSIARVRKGDATWKDYGGLGLAGAALLGGALMGMGIAAVATAGVAGAASGRVAYSRQQRRDSQQAGGTVEFHEEMER
eukprot:g4179.t1